MNGRRLVWVSSARWFRPLVLVVVFALVGSVALRGGGVRPPSPVDVASIATPKQRSGSAKGRTHAVAASVTAAKPDHKKRVPKRPKNALPLEQPYRPVQASDKTGLPAKKTPDLVKRAPAHKRPTMRGFNAKTSQEVPWERSRFGYHYRNADGTWTAKYSTRPVNYRDAKGSWQPINPTLVDTGKGTWRNSADSSRLTFSATASGQDTALIDFGGSKRFGFGIEAAGGVRGTVRGDTITYAGIRPDADLVLRSLNGGSVKEKIVLRSKDAPSVWEFPLRTDGLRPRMAADGSVELADAAGMVLARIPHGFMTDAKIDPHSGDGARSENVTYGLLQRGGRWVLKVTADAAWLADPERVYPVTIDPTAVWNYGDTADTYVQTGYSSPPNGEDELKAGTYNGGATKAATYLAFSQVDNDLSHAKIYDVDLKLMNGWSYSCKSEPVTVYPITQNWSTSSIADYPGPKHGSALASRSFARGYIAPGASSSACPAKWETIDLGSKGNALVQGWVNGTKSNYGLTVRASTSNSYGWKKFSSRETPNGPYLTITYSPYNAGYAFASSPPSFNPPVLNNQAGYVKVKVTNKGHDTWTPSNGYRLQYEAYDSGGHAIYHTPAQTVMPQNVSPGETVTVNAKVNPLPPGTWTLKFDMIYVTSNGYALFSDWGVPRTAQVDVTVPDVPSQLNEMYPPDNYRIGTLQPQLFADATSVDAWPSSNVTYMFTVCAPPWIDWSWCQSSDWQQTPKWTVPSGKLGWGQDYYWTVSVSDSGGATTNGPLYKFTTAVAQPAVTSHLSAVTDTGQEFNPQIGDYTTTATDAQVASVGPPLSVVRTYNSLDPRSDGAFGAGWTTRFDMSVVPDSDGTGNVVVTYPDGQQVRFAQNSDGTFTPPMGVPAVFAAQSGGGWKLMDKSSTTYIFDTDGRLTSVTDNRGRAQTLTYGSDGKLAQVSDTGGRSLWFTWNGAHVTTVTTDPVSGNRLTWTYGYDGDELTKVCPPTSSTACTTYSYDSGSHYRSVVLDTNPTGYWRLGESSGTTAASQVAQNLGTDKGTYSSVSLGATGALAGTSDTAAHFSGSSSVRLPDRYISRESGYLAVEAWFKTTGKGVILSYQNTTLSGVPSKYTPALYVGSDGKLHGEFWQGSATPITSTGTVNDGTWHHAVLSGEGSTQTLYLDGAVAGTLSGTIDHLNEPYVFVGDGTASSGWPQSVSKKGNFGFTGDIDDVAIYDAPLGLPAVQQHYAARLAAQQLSQVTTPDGRTHAAVTYDTGHDRIATQTDEHGGTWQLGTPAFSGTIDNPVETVTVTDPRGGTLKYTYDPLHGNRLTAQTDQLGYTTTYGYDTGGFLGKITDRNGNVTTLYNDERGNVTGRVRCRDADTCYAQWYTYAYNSDNVFDPVNDQLNGYSDGRSATFVDDTYHTWWSYDAYGQQTAQFWPNTDAFPDGLHGIGYTYTDGTEPAVGGGTTPPGLLKTRTNGGGQTTHTYAYTAAGDLASDTDAAGKATTYGYDALGRMTSKTVTSDAFPDGVTTTYTYDGLGHLLTQTGPATGNEVTGVTHTAQTRYTYDADGNTLTQTLADTTGGDPDRTTTYTYDDHGQVASVTDPEGGHETYAYDVTGARTDMTDATGAHYTYTYTARGELATRTLAGWTGSPNNPSSATDVVLDSYAYDPGGRVASHTDAMGRTLTYTYYGDDLLAQTTATNVKLNGSSTRTDVVVESRDYDGAGHLTKLVTGGGKTETDYSYDPIGNLSSQILDPDGLARRTDYTVDVDNNVIQTTRTDAGSDREEVTDHTYDQLHRVLSTTVENGDTDLTTSYTRDQLGDITAITDPRGNATGANPADYTTTMRYDPSGQLVQVTQPSVSVERNGQAATTATPTTHYGYDTAGERTQLTDPEGRTTTTGYDKDGRSTSQASPAYTPHGGSTITPTATIAYDHAGRITDQTDARGHTRHYVYDQLGNLARIEDPQLAGENAPGTWTADYDLLGEQLSATDPTGAQVQATYDDLGRQITSTVVERKPTPAAYTTHNVYDDAGNLTSRTRPAGDVTAYTVDAAGETTARTDPLGHTTGIDYDLDGHIVKITDPLGKASVATYDLAGRPTAVTDLDTDGTTLRTTSLGYDAAGNLTTDTNAEGHTTHRTYDAANRLTQLLEPVTDTTSITTTFGYDADGERTRVSDGRDNSTITTYNALGLPESVIEPATTAHPDAADRTWTTSYDANGNPIGETQPGGVQITRTYDELDRLTQQTGTGAEAATSDQVFGYDLAGRRLRVGAPGQDIITTYNDEGLPLTSTSPTGQTAQFTYDPNGRLATRTDTAGQATFAWNGNDDLTQATDTISGQTTARTYDDAGRLSAISYSNGAQRTYTYDGLDRTATDTLTTPTGTTLASATYTYDRDDHLTGKTTTGTVGAGHNTYTYDQSGRLTSWTNPAGTTTSYGWDNAGNRTQAGTTTYTYDERNELTADTNGGTYTYTPRGTLSSTSANGSSQTLDFDAFDRLITDDNVGYTYDSLDRVATRTQSGATSDFAYSTDQNTPAAITDGSGTVQSAYARTPDGALLAVTADGQNTTAISDPLHNDLTATLNTDGTALAGSTTYDPFGTTTAHTGQQSTVGYQGEYTDPDTGAVNMAARWYTPTTATFTSRDTWPLNPDPSIQNNHYTYANADPLDNIDPTGHFPLPAPVLTAIEAGGEVGAAGGPEGLVLGGALGLVGGGAAWLLWHHYHHHGSSSSHSSSPSQSYNPVQDYYSYHPCSFGPCINYLSPGAGHKGTPGRSGHHNYGGSGSGGGSGWIPIPPPSLAQIQHALEQKEINTAVPRPPTKSGITQGQLDRLRDRVEKNVTVAAGKDDAEKVIASIRSAFHPTSDRSPYSSLAGGSGKGGGSPPTPPSSAAAPDPDEDGPFPNRELEMKGDDLAEPRQGGVVPAEPGTPEFDTYLDSGNTEIRWAILLDDRIVALPNEFEVPGEGITPSSHGSLTGDVPATEDFVKSAGMARIAKTENGYEGLSIRNYSGHYWPSPRSLLYALEKFDQYGINFPREGVKFEFGPEPPGWR